MQLTAIKNLTVTDEHAGIIQAMDHRCKPGGIFLQRENKTLSVTLPLRREHDDIRRMMNLLAGFCIKLDRHEPIQIADLERIPAFLRIYEGAYHNGKEESLLYPAFESQGGDRAKKIIVLILQEHETAKRHLNLIDRMIRAYRDVEPNAETWLAVHLSKYISLQKNHIEKENNILFPAAENRLSERKKAELLDAFACANETRFGPARYAETQALLTNLEKNYKIDGVVSYH